MVKNSSDQISLYIFLKIFVVAQNHIAQTGSLVCKIIAGKYIMWPGEEKIRRNFFSDQTIMTMMGLLPLVAIIQFIGTWIRSINKNQDFEKLE